MDLPVKFPSETEVILEDVARFRSLAPAERLRSIQGLMADGAFLTKLSPVAAWIDEDSEEQRNLKHRRIREFIERHAN